MADAASKRLLPNVENTEAEDLKRGARERIDNRLAVQSWWLRPIVLTFTLSVILGFACLEWEIRGYVMGMDAGRQLPATLFIWAVSPVIAIAMITIFVLIGVFRGFKGNETDGVLERVLKAMSGSDTS